MSAGVPSAAHGAGRPRRDDGAQRLRLLMEAAIDLFLEHGYAGVSLKAIARRARVAVRTIYVKFGGKAGLFSRAMVYERERMQGSEPALEADWRPMPEVLREFGRRYHARVFSPRADALLRVVIGEASRHPDLALAFFNAGPAVTRASLVRYFSRPDIRASLRGDLSPDKLAAYLLSCLCGDQFGRVTPGMPREPAPDERERQLERALALFLSAALARTA